MKPELAAPGRYMVGPVPANSTLATERADKVVAPGYIQLSGTSFAAPVDLGGCGADPGQTPGLHARPGEGRADGPHEACRRAPSGSVGVGEIQVTSGCGPEPPNPNKALDQFVKPDLTGALDVRRGQLDQRGKGERLLGLGLVGGRVLGGHLRATSPGSTSRGQPSPGPTSPGPTSPGPTSPGRTPPTRTRPRATPTAIRRLRADAGAGGRDHGRPGYRSRPERLPATSRPRPAARRTATGATGATGQRRRTGPGGAG